MRRVNNMSNSNSTPAINNRESTIAPKNVFNTNSYNPKNNQHQDNTEGKNEDLIDWVQKMNFKQIKRAEITPDDLMEFDKPPKSLEAIPKRHLATKEDVKIITQREDNNEIQVLSQEEKVKMLVKEHVAIKDRSEEIKKTINLVYDVFYSKIETDPVRKACEKTMEDQQLFREKLTIDAIPTLTPDNFLIWHTQILHYLDSIDASAKSSASSQQQVFLFTDASRKCKYKAHNTLANHPKSSCWKLYPHLQPDFSDNSKIKDGQAKQSVSSFFSAQSTPVSSFILDLGSLCTSTSFTFEINSFTIINSSGAKITGNHLGNLPTIKFFNPSHQSHFTQSKLLHKSLGHDHKACEACTVAKVTKKSFHTKNSRASKPFEEIHMDLVGPIFPSSRKGHCYLLTVVDSCTRYCSVIPVKSKSDVSETISQAVSLEAKRLGYFPTVIHSDRSSEFINLHLTEFFNRHSIRARQSDAYTPQQSGLAESFNRTILESLRAIFQDTGLNKRLWNEIIKTSTLTLN
ncbi:hypothetical protein VP01_1520g1 [Puccinia sorghi]|uniref:Integrase catalytic domain-containing protein n=1 Tax=Puccinia sorghi TaxID=27349 RepID=A0A0L6VKL0_9BASI|nr:hypothetical protein VP01_1520g1 [Puccinia sorghi]